jgi:hypothetical protein
MPIGAFRQSLNLANFVEAGPTLGTLGLKKVVDNPNTGTTFTTNDSFGRQVDTSESYFIVSAPGESVGGSNSGSAYIYSTSTGNLLYSISNPNAFGTAANDLFGSAVGISDQYAIIAAGGEGDAGGAGSGKAYIYSTTTGSLLYTLNNPTPVGTSADDSFASDVDITDSYAIVGAPNEDDANFDSGKAYIYSTATGSLLHTLNNPNPFGTSESDFFGSDVAITESYSAVGALGEDSATGAIRGRVYIYSNSTGNLIRTLTNPTDAADSYSQRIGISEQYTIVSAMFAGSAGDEGRVYIYSNSTGALLYTLSNSGDGNFGNSVDISDTMAIVGVNGRSDAGGTGSGKAYVYSTTTGSLLYTLDNPNAFTNSFNDNFANQVGIGTTYAIVGAEQEDDAGTNQATDNQAGKAYLFTRVEADHIATPTPTGLTFIASGSSQGSTVQIPTTARAGDIAILFDNSTTTTNTIPSGWTSIAGGTTTGIRTNVSSKILTSGEVGSTITGMAGTTRKVVLVFRDWATTSPTIAVSTPTVQATTAAPTNQTITAGSGESIYFGVYGRTGTTGITAALNQSNKTSTQVNSVSTSGVSVRYTIFNAGPNAIGHSNATVTMTDGGTNVLISFRMDIS